MFDYLPCIHIQFLLFLTVIILNTSPCCDLKKTTEDEGKYIWKFIKIMKRFVVTATPLKDLQLKLA